MLDNRSESDGRKLRYCCSFAVAINRDTHYCYWHKRVPRAVCDAKMAVTSMAEAAFGRSWSHCNNRSCVNRSRDGLDSARRIDSKIGTRTLCRWVTHVWNCSIQTARNRALTILMQATSNKRLTLVSRWIIVTCPYQICTIGPFWHVGSCAMMVPAYFTHFFVIWITICGLCRWNTTKSH